MGEADAPPAKAMAITARAKVEKYLKFIVARDLAMKAGCCVKVGSLK